jgi:class 3 adenylate cyclase
MYFATKPSKRCTVSATTCVLRALTAATSSKPARTARPDEVADDYEARCETVMFSDLVGSTGLSARMDPEDLREVISAYQKSAIKAICKDSSSSSR